METTHNDSNLAFETLANMLREIKEILEEMGNARSLPAAEISPELATRLDALSDEIKAPKPSDSFSAGQIERLKSLLSGAAKYVTDKVGERQSTADQNITNQINKLSDSLVNLKIVTSHHEHKFVLDFKNSKAALTMGVMGFIILFLVGMNILQFSKNCELADNDLKYRYIKMRNKASAEDIFGLEEAFGYDRNSKTISQLRKNVEHYELLVKEQHERDARARLNAAEAERLQHEAETVKGRK